MLMNMRKKLEYHYRTHIVFQNNHMTIIIEREFTQNECIKYEKRYIQ